MTEQVKCGCKHGVRGKNCLDYHSSHYESASAAKEDAVALNAAGRPEQTHTALPWKLCFHLESIEHDASCPCGFPGDIWGADGETVICTMGQLRDSINDPEGALMQPPADRPTTLANAQFIVTACNNYEALKNEIAELKGYIGNANHALNMEISEAQELAKNYEALKQEVALWRSEHDPCPFSLELDTLKESLKNSHTVHTAILRGDIVLTKETARHIAGIDYENEMLKQSHAAILEELSSIAAFAVGNGDICEVIAQRAHKTIYKASEVVK